MAARAHNVAAESIKGTSAILNLPELTDSLPRLVSVARQDVQAAAAKAAQMEIFDSPQSMSSSSSLSSLVSKVNLSSPTATNELEEWSEILELPSLGIAYDSYELSREFEFFDSADCGAYPLTWLQSIEECGYNHKARDKVGIRESSEYVLWDY